MRSLHLASLALLISSTMWGLSWIPLKTLASNGMDGTWLISVAYISLFLVVLPFAWGKRFSIRNNQWPLIGIFFAGGLANICFNYAMMYGEVVRAMVLFYLLPVWGVLGGYFILKEKTSVGRWFGVIFAVFGVFILLGGKNIFSSSLRWLDLIALASGVLLAANIMLFRFTQAVPVSVKLGFLFAGGALISLLMVSLGVGVSSSVFPHISVVKWTVFYALTWLLMANVIAQWAVTRLPAGRSSILMVVELIAAVFSAIWIGGEAITSEVVIGGGMIFVATLIEIFQGQRERAKEIVLDTQLRYRERFLKMET